MMYHVYETDNGPGGISWEAYDSDGKWQATYPDRETVMLECPRAQGIELHPLPIEFGEASR